MEKKEANWTKREINFFKRLNEPIKIQNFLDRIEYNPLVETKSPRWIIKEKRANCFEGALFAAAALRQIGHKPLLVDLTATNDDDHVISVFKKKGYWGAVAKSNLTTLRFREPVYKSLRELVMSYFNFFFNTLGQKTFRSYSLPLNLSQFDERNWMTTDEDLEYISSRLNQRKHFKIITPQMTRALQKVDKNLLKAVLSASEKTSLYKPKKG
jgi:hypothetical protein